MKKSLISLAIAASMAASGAALAGDATVYGNVHLSIDDNDTSSNTDEIQMNSQTSAIGVRGSEDLGNGMKALFMIEFQIDPSERATNITDRDQWVGIKGGMGTVKFGTVTSNYKALGGKVDPMYRTALEGRGSMMGTQSSQFHGGAGRTNGRMTDALQYESPEMGGMSMVINTTFDGAQSAPGTSIDETLGVGFRYEGKGFMAYLDFIDIDTGLSATSNGAATKVGGKFKAGPVTIGAQYESIDEDLGATIGRDYIFLSANYGIDSNNAVFLSVGQKGEYKNGNDGSDAFAVMYDHKLSKQTNVYVGYGDRSDDAAGSPGRSTTTLGIRKKF